MDGSGARGREFWTMRVATRLADTLSLVSARKSNKSRNHPPLGWRVLPASKTTLFVLKSLPIMTVPGTHAVRRHSPHEPFGSADLLAAPIACLDFIPPEMTRWVNSASGFPRP